MKQSSSGLLAGWLGTRKCASLLLLTLFLFLLVTAQWESLHHTLHPDANQSWHQCAVTLVQTAQLDAPAPVVLEIPLRMLPLVEFPEGVSLCAPLPSVVTAGRGPPRRS